MAEYDFGEIVDRRGEDGIKWNLYPDDVLPMWIADSDFRAPREVVEALQKRVEHGVFGYTDCESPAFAEACAHWVDSRFGWAASPEWVTYTPGVCAGLALCVKAFSSPGDQVVMLTPTYPPFYSIPHENGRYPVASPLIHRGLGDYQIDFADLESKLAHPRARLLLLCNPQNPTGRVFTHEELLCIGELCRRYGVLVISDEIHCDYVFAPHKHIPFPSLSAELAEISLTAINPSKTFNIADLHTAALIVPNPVLRQRLQAEISAASLGRHSLGIIAAVTAYTQCSVYADEVRDYTFENLKYAVDYINAFIPRVKAYLPESTYVLWLDCSALELDQDKLMSLFLEKGRLALNSGVDYGPEGLHYVRINLACPRALAEDGLKRLKAAVDSLSNQ
ncbi:MAG: pyridoxal phosphate-dependent aminotransferase [Desulfovibrionaceae bacterium]|nr:pyridoxal phosphate-dependent aminotransferase [Desulfovibrionaceae bacterium]